MSQRGFTPILVILGTIILLVVFGGGYYFNQSFLTKMAKTSLSSSPPNRQVKDDSEVKTYSLIGYTFIDNNDNSKFDPDEKTLEDIQVKLILPTKEEASTRSDKNGRYQFLNLKPNKLYQNQARENYIVAIVNPFSEGKDYEVAGILSEAFQVPPNKTLDFPLRPRTNIQGITINVFNDDNGDGLRQADESGFPEAEISLYNSGSGVTVKTDSSGSYSLDNIYGGYLSLIMKIPDGYFSTTYEERDGGYINTFVNLKSPDRIINLGIKPGKGKNREYDPTRTYEVSGWIFIDNNGNGLKDSGEKGLVCVSSCINSFEGKGFLMSLVKVGISGSQNGGIVTNSEGYYSTKQWLKNNLTQPAGGVYHISVPTYAIPGYKPTTSFDKTFTVNSDKVVNFGVIPQ